MKQFAKVFTLENDEQVLVHLTTDERGYPMVKLVALVDGMEISLGPIYNHGTDDAEADAAWDKAEAYFNSFDQDKAVKFRKDAEKIATGALGHEILDRGEEAELILKQGQQCQTNKNLH